ncbi:MAG: DUF1501 domain-containing protein [Verrucomicrobiota bacterium]|nr:DUF1501 domain-containing protein [Verrucomicrobiota bacterium]
MNYPPAPLPRLFPCSGRHASHDLLTRREMLRKSAGGLGGIALSWLLAQSGLARASAPCPALNLLPKPPHFAPRARNVIFLYMGGGPSHMDLLDPKPLLAKYDGQPIPFRVEQRDLHSAAKVMASPFKFAKYGHSGLDVSELLPHLATVADELAVVRSGVTTRVDHGEALLMMHTGRPISGFPTMGSWITYGLGTENANLPAYVAMPDGPSERVRNATSAGWLPALYQGTPMNTGEGDPFFFLNPPGDSSVVDRHPAEFLRLTQALNRRHRAARPEVSQLDARIQNFELAARMQVESMKQVDIAAESPATRKLYGLDDKKTEPFGRRCLIARRLVEAGVRFVHIMRNDWDHHSGLKFGLTRVCAETDQPVAGLLKDLKGRGLLDETLVVWTGEFGRLPVVEGSDGRDHNPHGFTFWMAGGGVKAGTIYGATDEFGYRAAENPVRVADLHATLFHLLGLQHDKLVFEFEGREETITGVESARVVKELIS